MIEHDKPLLTGELQPFNRLVVSIFGRENGNSKWQGMGGRKTSRICRNQQPQPCPSMPRFGC